MPSRAPGDPTDPGDSTTRHDADYAGFLAGVETSLGMHAKSGAAVFRTAATGLWTTYLDALPSDRQRHDCSTCRRFIGRFGGLVTLSKNGKPQPALWDPARVPEFYRAAVTAMRGLVADAPVSGVHLSAGTRLGAAERGGWTHLSVCNTPFHHALLTPAQAVAAKREDHATVARALSTFTPAMLTQALRLLKADTLSRSEKFIGPVTWLAALHADRAKAATPAQRDNILWQAIATAPAGYCHPRASVVGSLLEDIATGLPFEDIKTRFAAKLHPLRYQRPQAAPSAGNIAQAEKMFATMGLAPSLARRFARLDEVETVWRPQAAPAVPSGGLFAHLRPKPGKRDVRSVSLPTLTMTWEKFSRTILADGADGIELMVPAHGNFTGLLTATNLDAPPLLKWDRPEARNPVSSYVYHGGSDASRWGLRGAEWCVVTGITRRPNEWGTSPQSHLGQGAILLLAGAVDSRLSGIALFPETLRAELHAVRATIEAYSKSASVTGHAEAGGCGFDIGRGTVGVRLRVTTQDEPQEILIDRWD